jgi:hypothetical protein
MNALPILRVEGEIINGMKSAVARAKEGAKVCLRPPLCLNCESTDGLPVRFDIPLSSFFVTGSVARVSVQPVFQTWFGKIHGAIQSVTRASELACVQFRR